MAVAVAVAGLTKRFFNHCKKILYHLILVRRWLSPSQCPPHKRLGASKNRPMALAEAIPERYPKMSRKLLATSVFACFVKKQPKKKMTFCWKVSESLRTHPNASDCIRTHPNASERIRTHSETSENVEKFTKTSRNFAKTSRTRG